MSGTNPFRRRADQGSSKADRAVVNTAFPNKAEARVSPIDTDVHRPPKPKTGKTVRIVSPHSATSDDKNGMSQSLSVHSRSINSSPPPSAISPESSDDESPEDPFSAGSDGTAGSAEDEGTRENTLMNQGISQSKTLRPSSMPANPFSRTIANLGTKSKLGSSPNSERNQSEQEPSNSRPHYDVDDFKRLLLTGEKSASRISTSAAPPVGFQSQHNVGDSSSNTDASSTSRQSIFEPMSGPLQESPSTSHEGSPSDDDRQQLVSQPPNSLKSKPSTPRHRHGKLVKANAPLTVSFEDPSLSFSSPNALSKSPEIPSDIDKSLPPLPPSSDPTRDPIVAEDSLNPELTHTPASVPASPTTQKRNPPVPPISRRHSQLKQKPFPSSERPIAISEDLTTKPMELSRSPPDTASKAPPPPPPRRAGGLVRVNSSSSASASASIPPMQTQSSADDITSNPSKTRPPAPPNHSPSISSVKRQQNQPFLPGIPTAVPPPPPRRRGSSQSSYTPSRLSGEYRTAATERLRSDSGASSISHLQMTPMTATPSSTESKDIMADLSVLQREVDELRGKFRE